MRSQSHAPVRISTYRLISLVINPAVACLCVNFTTGKANNAHAEQLPADVVRVELPVQALLAPATGYEEKNNVEVVLYGSLPNSCYSIAEQQVERVSQFTYRIHQFAIHTAQGACANEALLPDHKKMIIPFSENVVIGRLHSGVYQFLYQKIGVGEQARSLSVALNETTDIDSLPYAAVSAVHAPDVINGTDSIDVTISGVLNSTCSSLNDEVKVIPENDVYVLLPTVKIDHSAACKEVLIPFQKQVHLGRAPMPGIYLIHTRSMNGKAVSKVINVMK